MQSAAGTGPETRGEREDGREGGGCLDETLQLSALQGDAEAAGEDGYVGAGTHGTSNCKATIRPAD
jgi:hypothetical protein